MRGRRRLLTVAIVGVVALAIAGAAIALVRRTGTASAQIAFRVDPTMRPSVSDVEPVEGSTQRRPVGALADPEGTIAELVLDEVIVHVRDDAELQAFLDRWNARVVDSFPADEDGQDHLVRVDANRADTATLASDLALNEPKLTGELRTSDERVLRLLALAAAEWKRGTEVVIDWLVEPADIGSGEAYEASDISFDHDNDPTSPRVKNVFGWPYMVAGGPLDTGVAVAWQLLRARGKLKPQVRFMVLDGGFSSNPDFPDDTKIRKAEWGYSNPSRCKGKPCPWHGTHVAMTAAAKVDNEYGVAGSGGPVISRLIVVGNDTDYWGMMRRIEDIVEQERPDVVNLSFTREVSAGTAYARKWTDRRMRHVRDKGALVVAAAGNYGRTVDPDTLWLPCESEHVMCVGGYAGDGTLHKDSNFGEGDSPTSVEIYGPYCVRVLNNPGKFVDFSTAGGCGTSYAAPFVGGVAALVMAADPSLKPAEVRKILNDTANVGGLGSKVTGSQRRINALQAVARALGVDVVPPDVTITAPANNKQLRVDNWVDLRGTAADFMGRTLTISWESDRDGHLATGSSTSVPKLSEGTHILTAKATDNTGRTGEDTVRVKVVDTPPQVTLVSPSNGYKTDEGNAIPLVATSVDPDTWQPIPDSDAKWEVRRNGTVVHNATGHVATLPRGKALPGSYSARFTADGVSVQASFTVVAVPPGQTKPSVTVTKPNKNRVSLGTGGGPRPVDLAATATDAEDGAVAGTRYRWTARSGTQTRTLCVGSAVPGAAPPGSIVTYRNCASVTASLGLTGGATTTWTVEVEAFDSTGRKGTDSVIIEIQLAVP